MRLLALLLLLTSHPLLADYTLIAHRGASAEAPENTLPAFRRAILLGVDMIEVDLRLTQEGVPVVFHDADIERTTDSYKPIALKALTLPELKRHDAGRWFSPGFRRVRVPTLAELLRMRRGNVGLYLEFKPEGRDAEMAEAIVPIIKKWEGKNRGPIYLASFSTPFLEKLHKALPHLPLIGIADNRENMEKHFSLPLAAVAIKSKLVTKELVRELHKRDVKVYTWTVDLGGPAKDLLKLGVDGIVTNNPRTIANTIQR